MCLFKVTATSHPRSYTQKYWTFKDTKQQQIFLANFIENGEFRWWAHYYEILVCPKCILLMMVVDLEVICIVQKTLSSLVDVTKFGIFWFDIFLFGQKKSHNFIIKRFSGWSSRHESKWRTADHYNHLAKYVERWRGARQSLSFQS